MKLSYLLLILPIVILNSCGLQGGNFNQQKYTNLKHKKSSVTTASIEDSQEISSDSNETFAEHQAINNSFSELETEYTETSIDNQTLLAATDGFEAIESLIETDQIITPTKELSRIEFTPIPLRKLVSEKDEWKKNKDTAHILLSIGLGLLIGSLITVILLGGINTLILALILLGVSALIASFVFYVRASKQRKKEPWMLFRNKGLLWLGIAALTVGLGLILAIVFWSEVILLIAAVIAGLVLVLSIFNFVKGIKGKRKLKKQ